MRNGIKIRIQETSGNNAALCDSPRTIKSEEATRVFGEIAQMGEQLSKKAGPWQRPANSKINLWYLQEIQQCVVGSSPTLSTINKEAYSNHNKKILKNIKTLYFADLASCFYVLAL